MSKDKKDGKKEAKKDDHKKGLFEKTEKQKKIDKDKNIESFKKAKGMSDKLRQDEADAEKLGKTFNKMDEMRKRRKKALKDLLKG